LQHLLFLKNLNDNNISLCGVDFRINPIEHFCGNFWWAKSDYIQTLVDPHIFINKEIKNVHLTKRHYCEFWITSNLNNNYKILHQPPSDFSFYKQKLNIKDYEL